MLRICIANRVLPTQACLEPTGEQQCTSRIRRNIAFLGTGGYCEGGDCMLDFNGVHTSKVWSVFSNIEELSYQLSPGSNAAPIEITECGIRQCLKKRSERTHALFRR